ncbi:vanadium-dependent haloperoxidase [Chengkuizengella axinellae]|uniref:Vanadium-dependent haloperoxidase n=1 Tax=Chengkuizengella axinellae TaxID=3064388 RepID=A0ABT9IZ49_9BACL|nr:vanadium-dependent haloperoxidase [Chengkuizengella sp. 2205SS18-9]MDP5274498.1 vanadium-dependent haloperoxidase [Chengkuizengella sp. 2205SS18-9]
MSKCCDNFDPNYLLWNEVPYAGEEFPPTNPEDPYSDSWPMYYYQRCGSKFEVKQTGELVYFTIKHPNYIDWGGSELEAVLETANHLDEDMKKIAKYWGTGVATKQWLPVLDILVDTYGVTAPYAARLESAVLAAANDAFIITWYYKFLWLVARPDQYDQELATCLCTPRHPTYPSGHAAVAGCVANMLKYFFPGEAAKLDELAKQCALSRLYALVHFPIDNDEGLKLGYQVADHIIPILASQRDSTGKPIDVPYTDNLDAALPPFPPEYDQVIPFDFPDNCTSLTRPDCCN